MHSVFSDCNSLTTLDLSSFDTNNVKEMSGMLRNCTKLKTVSVGSNVRKVGNKAFKGCKNLKKFQITSKVLYSIGKKAFKGVSSRCVYVLPRSKRNQYVKMIKVAKK